VVVTCNCWEQEEDSLLFLHCDKFLLADLGSLYNGAWLCLVEANTGENYCYSMFMNGRGYISWRWVSLPDVKLIMRGCGSVSQSNSHPTLQVFIHNM
jgi:hypothetical protein